MMTTAEYKLTGKAMIVGASGGMGGAVACALARAGVDVALLGRNESQLDRLVETCRESGVEAFARVCDIAAIDTIEGSVQDAIARLGGLNFLVNCAGISRPGKLHETDPAVGDAILDTNLRAHLYLVRYAVPEINKSPGGAVIKIGAVNHPYSGVNTYLAANRGGEGYAEALFEDVREFGTRVCNIKPGWVNTPLVAARDGIDLDLMIQPDDIAQTVLFVLTLPVTACVTEMTILPQRSPYIES